MVCELWFSSLSWFSLAFCRIDEKPGDRWDLARVAIDSLGAAMLVTIILDLWRIYLGPIIPIPDTKQCIQPGIPWFSWPWWLHCMQDMALECIWAKYQTNEVTFGSTHFKLTKTLMFLYCTKIYIFTLKSTIGVIFPLFIFSFCPLSIWSTDLDPPDGQLSSKHYWTHLHFETYNQHHHKPVLSSLVQMTYHRPMRSP